MSNPNTDDEFAAPLGTSRREFLKASGLGSVYIMLAPHGVWSSPPSSRQTELQSGWRIISARNVSAGGEQVSCAEFDASSWFRISRMPATVLQALEDAGVYKDVYYGMNIVDHVPQDLWKQDWWYRTTFDAAAHSEVYSLIFHGINYRADVRLNGHLVADKSQVVGAYNSFEFIVSKYIRPGGENVLAVKVTPEQRILDVNGVELGDSWLDWINFKYLGYHDPKRNLNVSFVPDRNAGVWQRVLLSSTGKVLVRNPYVETDLPLPSISPASLTVYCDLRNGAAEGVAGTLQGEISRPGKTPITFQQEVTLQGGETKEVFFSPAAYHQLSITDPDLWWPCQFGEPALYQLRLDFSVGGRISDAASIDFGTRKVTQHRDSDNDFPKVGTGGNFWLQVNGKDFLIRGACYTPDLLFKSDPERDQAIVTYARDMGLNMLRWECKLADNTMLDRCDRAGIPVMQGWMCCQQWEHWKQWDDEDHWVALASLRARIYNLRHHAAAFIWADGSDGRPPDAVGSQYHQVLQELHWQNGVVDTVSNYQKDARG